MRGKRQIHQEHEIFALESVALAALALPVLMCVLK
jgi:hypothetical protein